MPIGCVDGEIPDVELTAWEVAPLVTRVALTRDQVRAAFVGTTLSRGVALLGLTRAQICKLFPTSSRKKNALSMRRWAAKLTGERVREVLAGATWHQVRVAARFDDEEAQIRAALAFTMGLRFPRR